MDAIIMLYLSGTVNLLCSPPKKERRPKTTERLSKNVLDTVTDYFFFVTSTMPFAASTFTQSPVSMTFTGSWSSRSTSG
jgi:hypothetical protein